jgi:predicted nucleic acid-binding protein
MRPTLDSNVLVYALLEPEDTKGRLAVELIDRAARRGVLAVQALGEFLWVARRQRPDLAADAAELVEQLREAFTTFPTSIDLLFAAADLHARHQVPFWDAVIWKAGASAGATLFLSEDLQDGFSADGMRVLNPFDPANLDELNRLLPT